MTISFDEIPYDYLKPGTLMEVAPSYDQMGTVPYPVKAILFVQKLASGTAQAKQLYRITRPDQGRGLFGAGSVGQQMVEAYKATNKITDVYAIALADNAAGVAATGTFVITGTATSSGALAVYVGKVRIPIAVQVGMTAAQVATAINAAIGAIADLPVTSGVVTGTVTCTAKHKGEVGNHIHLAAARKMDDTIPAGLTVVVTAMSGGATNPDLDELIDVIATQWFTDWALPWDDSTNMGVLSAALTARFLATGKLDATAYHGHRGNFSAITAKGALTNSPHITGMGAKNSPSTPWEWAAASCALGSFHLTNDPARQLRGLALVGIEGPAPADQFIETEQNLLLQGGVSTFMVDVDGTVRVDRMVSTYKTSPLGVPDRAWLDIMVAKVCTRIRYDWNSYVLLQYPRCKLAPDNSPAARADVTGAVVTPRTMNGSWAARCALYEQLGWIVNVRDTANRSVFEIDQADKNRLNAKQPIDIIGNLMVLAGRLEFEV